MLSFAFVCVLFVCCVFLCLMFLCFCFFVLRCVFALENLTRGASGGCVWFLCFLLMRFGFCVLCVRLSASCFLSVCFVVGRVSCMLVVNCLFMCGLLLCFCPFVVRFVVVGESLPATVGCLRVVVCTLLFLCFCFLCVVLLFQ